jgi:hypothetical protein
MHHWGPAAPRARSRTPNPTQAPRGRGARPCISFRTWPFHLSRAPLRVLPPPGHGSAPPALTALSRCLLWARRPPLPSPVLLPPLITTNTKHGPFATSPLDPWSRSCPGGPSVNTARKLKGLHAPPQHLELPTTVAVPAPPPTRPRYSLTPCTALSACGGGAAARCATLPARAGIRHPLAAPLMQPRPGRHWPRPRRAAAASSRRCGAALPQCRSSARGCAPSTYLSRFPGPPVPGCIAFPQAPCPCFLRTPMQPSDAPATPRNARLWRQALLESLWVVPRAGQSLFSRVQSTLKLLNALLPLYQAPAPAPPPRPRMPPPCASLADVPAGAGQRARRRRAARPVTAAPLADSLPRIARAQS